VIRGGWGFYTRHLDLNHTWSLAIEEQFYLLWPLVVWAVPPKRALRVALWGVGIALLARILMFVLDLEGHGALNVYTLTPVRLDGLLLGAALAVHARTGMGGTVARDVIRLLPLWLAPTTALFLRFGPSHEDPWMATVGFTFVAFSSTALVSMALAPETYPRFAALLRSSALTALGRYSYGIYLFHGVLRPSVRAMTLAIMEPPAASGQSALALAAIAVGVGSGLAIVLAVTVYHAWEAPFLRLKDRFFHDGSAPADAGAPHPR
jgi:peptidoglycan/LPS O-acetylase OafA/YrhL